MLKIFQSMTLEGFTSVSDELSKWQKIWWKGTLIFLQLFHGSCYPSAPVWKLKLWNDSIQDLIKFILVDKHLIWSGFPDAALFMFLVLPATIVLAGRSFLKLKLISNCLRTTIPQISLASLPFIII